MTGQANERIWTAALVVIGDEILSGRTQDKNVAQIAAWLNVQGIRLAEVRVVGDVTAAIVEAVNQFRPYTVERAEMEAHLFMVLARVSWREADLLRAVERKRAKRGLE